MDNSKIYRKGIQSKRWVKLRRHQLSLHPLCEMCEREGRLTPATEVHHITPVEDMPEDRQMALMFDPHNLMSLCHRHHVEVHIEMGKGGNKERTRRVTEKGLQMFAEKYGIERNLQSADNERDRED